MFNKFAKSIRWLILAGMLYTLYTMILKDDIEFNNQTDEKTLVKMAKKTDKSRDRFVINRQLCKLKPESSEYQKAYLKSVKEQANKLIDVHEKMLLPVPLGNYRYIENIEFAKDKSGNFALVLNMTKIFNEELDKKTQNTLKSMFEITHDGIYTHFGFNKGMKLLLVPTFDTLDNVEIIDLNRKTAKL